MYVMFHKNSTVGFRKGDNSIVFCLKKDVKTGEFKNITVNKQNFGTYFICNFTNAKRLECSSCPHLFVDDSSGRTLGKDYCEELDSYGMLCPRCNKHICYPQYTHIMKKLGYEEKDLVCCFCYRTVKQNPIRI